MPKPVTPSDREKAAKKYITSKYNNVSAAIKQDNYVSGSNIELIINQMTRLDTDMNGFREEALSFCNAHIANTTTETKLKFGPTNSTALSTKLFLKSLSRREIFIDDSGSDDSAGGKKRKLTEPPPQPAVRVNHERFTISDDDLDALLADSEYRREAIITEIERRAKLGRDIYHRRVIDAFTPGTSSSSAAKP